MQLYKSLKLRIAVEMEEKGIPYFRHLLSKNKNELKRLCEEWGKYSLDCSLPEQVLGDIRSTIGLANLLMQQKLTQFEGLIDDSQNKRGEKDITCTDLLGFWDMVYFEVEKIFKKFGEMEKCKNNNWEVVTFQTEKQPLKKKLPLVQKNHTTAKYDSLAARERLAEAKRKMKMKFKEQSDTDFTVEIREPSKENSNVEKESSAFSKSEAMDSIHYNIQKTKKSNSVSKCTGIENLLENISVANEKVQKKGQSKNKEGTLQNKENLECTKEKELEFDKTPKLSSKNNKHKSCPNSASSGKKSGKYKEYLPLQCVTRSAKKALLEQNNLKA